MVVVGHEMEAARGSLGRVWSSALSFSVSDPGLARIVRSQMGPGGEQSEGRWAVEVGVTGGFSDGQLMRVTWEKSGSCLLCGLTPAGRPDPPCSSELSVPGRSAARLSPTLCCSNVDAAGPGSCDRTCVIRTLSLSYFKQFSLLLGRL